MRQIRESLRLHLQAGLSYNGITNSPCACLVSCTYSWAHGAASVCVADRPANSPHTSGSMPRTVAKNGVVSNAFERYAARGYGFTECLLDKCNVVPNPEPKCGPRSN